MVLYDELLVFKIEWVFTVKKITINKLENNRSKFPMLDKCLGGFLKEDERAYLFPLILDWTGSDAHAVNWLQNEKIPAFGNKTALEVFQNNQLNLFLEYIQHIEYGGFS